MARKLVVEVVGDTRQFDRALDRSSKKAQTFSAQFKRQALATGAGFLGAASVEQGLRTSLAVMQSSVNAASDLNEQMSKSQAVFGDSAAAVEKWSETTTKVFGISKRQALATAASFGALFQPLGLVGDTAARQAERLTELGGDLASFYNTSVQDALDAIRSGLIGEAEPLRRYGALLSESRVQAQAMADTGKKTAASLTDQEKVMARIKIIFQDTTKAQGDAAKTGGNLAGQMRQFNAQVDDLQSNLGQLLIPALTNTVSALNDLMDALESLSAVKIPEIKIPFGITIGGKSVGSLIAHGAGQALENLPTIGPIIDAIRRARDTARAVGLKGGGAGGAAGGAGGVTAANQEGIARLKGLAEQQKAAAEAARKAAAAARAAAARRVGQRNTWFDATIARQLDRVQDLSLRNQLARLRQIAQEVRARLAVTKDATRRLTLEDKLLEILREQKSVQGQIGDEIRAANQALKDRADAIKSAVLDRLQARQTDILNKRALADAKEQLRIARQIGGPKGIQAATRTLQDVRMDMLIARVSRMPATLTAGGQFALGNVVTINVHGVTDPDEVARQVAAVLQRRGRRTTSQTRGHQAGTPAGAH